MTQAESTDLLIIGSGIAGLTVALEAADHADVLILAKADPWDSATSRAQGGVAAAVGPDDSPERHLQDTMDAGAGLCQRAAVDVCVREGPDAIRWVESQGVHFCREADGTRNLGREGGHHRRRILHVKDMTGQELVRVLLDRAQAHPRITIRSNWLAVDLITRVRLGDDRGHDRCLGAYAMDMGTGNILPIRAGVTILATGGAGKVYLYTTNSDVSTGDGVAMAWRAGATIANMEFYQFHPTCLHHASSPPFLISEAVRGEGGILVLRDGERFMPRYHEMAELAPRDVVARAIDAELKRTGEPCAYLDVTHLDGAFLESRFPTIFGHCLSLGVDIRTDPVPVVPAAHYLCGGVRTDHNGWTSLHGLYAVGETACTGLHGANRLASNSLLEGLVFGRRTAQDALKTIQTRNLPDHELPPWHTGFATDPEEAVVVSQNWHEIRRFMWNYLGIVRSDMRIQRALRRLMTVREEIRADYWSFILTPALIELRNLADIAYLVLEMASMRKESRGLHYNVDYPDRDDEHWQHDTVLRRKPKPYRK
ncbi:MAG: L-aspartate oxidase [Pseudomonadota bacterium]